MEDQLLEGGVEVVGLGEAVACMGLVDHTVFHLSLHPAGRRRSEPDERGRRNMFMLGLKTTHQ